MYWLYRNNRNPNKFIELKRYPDGHYVWKQYIVSMFGKNYVGTTIKQCQKGVWRRVTRRTFTQALEDYRLVDVVQRR